METENNNKKVEPFVSIILNKFKSKCNKSHSTCSEIQKLICENISNGNIYPEYILDEYINFLVTNSFNGYLYHSLIHKCISIPENYISALSSLIAFYCPSDSTLNLLLEENCTGAFEAIINNQYPLSSILLNNAIKLEKKDIANLLSKYDKLDVSVEQMEASSYKDMNQVVINIMARKILPTKTTLLNAIDNNNFALVKIILEIGNLPLDVSFLVAACETKNYNIIKLFLDLKLIPNNECFNNVVAMNKPNKYCDHSRRIKNNINKKQIADIVDLLVEYGYKITYDDIIFATINQIKLNNIEFYNIKLDEKFLEVCAEHNFYPYQLKNISPTIKCLEKACKKLGNLTAIKSMVNNGIKPNTECLRQACKYKNNLQTIKFLISHGAKPDLKCLENISQVISNKSLSTVLEEYKKVISRNNINGIDIDNINSNNKVNTITENEQLNTIDNDILTEDLKVEYDNDLISDDKLVDKSNNVLNNELKALTDEKIVPTGLIEPPEQNSLTISETNYDTSSSNTSMNITSKKKIIVKGKKQTFNTDVDSIKNSSTNEKQKYDIITIGKPTKEIKIRDNYSLNDDLSLLLTKKKSSKMLYIEVKQKLLNYIKNNNLFDKNNKLMIQINKDLSKISGYEIDKYINFVEFDNFVAHCLFR